MEPHLPGNLLGNVVCKCCGAKALYVVENDYDDPDDRFVDVTEYVCALCKDDFVCMRSDDGDPGFMTYTHQEHLRPKLTRMTSLKGGDDAGLDLRRRIGTWTYLIDDEPADEETWFSILRSRRRVLKSQLVN